MKNNHPKSKYKIANWSEYNNTLKQRGSLEVWISEEAIEKWNSEPTGKKGAQGKYSDLAIETTLTIGKVFHQKLRQTQGLCESIVKIMKIKLEIPNYTTLSRRSSKLPIQINKIEKGKVIMIADSTGLKVYGEGEWKARRYGFTKRRTWRKLHISIDADGEIRAVELTGNEVTDSYAGEELLKQQGGDIIEKFYGDGGYDRLHFYKLCQEQGIKNFWECK